MAFKMKYGKGMPFNYGSSLKKSEKDQESEGDAGKKKENTKDIIENNDTYTLGTDKLGEPITKNSSRSSKIDTKTSITPKKKEKKKDSLGDRIKNTAKTIVGGATGVLINKAKDYYDDNIKGTTRTKTKTTTDPSGKKTTKTKTRTY